MNTGGVTVNDSASSMLALQIPTFRRLFMAAFLFNVGHMIQVVASSWVVLELTGSPFWVSLSVGAPLLPLLVLSLPAGAAADLIDRRRILVMSSTVMVAAGTAVVWMWLSQAITAPRLIAASLLFGLGIAFFVPAWQAVIPTIVPVGVLPGAIALESASGGAATAIGPAAGGLLVATVGPGWAFAAAVIGYAIILGTVARTDVSRYVRDVASFRTAIPTGLRYLRFSRRYRGLLVVGSAFGLLSASLRALLPNLTNDVLGGSSAMYGLLLAAFGTGALVGGLTRAQGARLLGHHMVPWSILAFGLTIGVVATSATPAATTVAVLFAGGLWTWILATLSSSMQLLTPDWVRGRTMSTFTMCVFGVAPLGSVLAGVLGDRLGVAGSLFVAGGFLLLLAIAAMRVALPVLERIVAPVAPDNATLADLPAGDDQLPVMVINTWLVDGDEVPEFRRLLQRLRQLRLSTGAYQWTAYWSHQDPRQVSEVFHTHSWQELVQAQRRLDTHGLALIRAAAVFGRRNERCATQCLVAIDHQTLPYD